MIINNTQSNLVNINFIDIINPIKLQHSSRRIQILEHANAMKLLNSYRKVPQLITELQSPIVVNSIKIRKDSNYSHQQSSQQVEREKQPLKIDPEANSSKYKTISIQNSLPQIPLTVMSQSMKVNETTRNSHSIQSPMHSNTKRSLFRPQQKPINNTQNSNSTTITTGSSKDTSQNISNQQPLYPKNIIYSYCGKPRKRKLEVTAKSFIVYDQIENKTISQRKCNKRLEVASLTKIMTFYVTLVTLEKFKYNPKDIKIKVTKKASEIIGTTAELRYNDILSLEDLLYGLMLPSGNDAAVLIAQAIGTIILFHQIDKKLDIKLIDIEQLSAEGHYYNLELRTHQCPIELFIDQMNIQSQLTGQSNTQFACVHGLANEENYSSCTDIALLSIECLKYELFRQVVACKEYSAKIPNKQYDWKNTNKLLDKGFMGIKTGITDTAGPCLASAYRINELEQYIIVVLSCKNLQLRFDETLTLLQHAKNKKFGDTSVGKSCLLLQYIDKNFRPSHEATIGVEFGAKQLIIKQKVIKIQIWDTAGQESFRSITRSYYRGSIGAILVYDVTRRDTFDNASTWVNEIKNHGNDKITIILVGNKSDLNDIRQVPEDEAKEMAKKNGLEFIEVSAKQNLNVDQAFYKVAEKIYKKIEANQIDLTNEKCGVKLGQRGSFVDEKTDEEKKDSKGCC